MSIFQFAGIISVILLYSCSNGSSGEKSSNGLRTVAPEPTIFKLTEPAHKAQITKGDDIALNLISKEKSIIADSVEIHFDSNPLTTLRNGEHAYKISTAAINPGTRRIRAVVHFSNGKKEVHSSEIILISNITPRNYSYKVLNRFPHDKGAYTQGFEIHGNYLYEGTGQYGESSLRKTELETGEILKARTLSSEFFGEGITILNNRIYQITYHSQLGFVYELETFEEIKRVYYQNKEGWGLTNNGSEIIMSDGTHVLYFLNPEHFSVNRKVEVSDNKGLVPLLNELEWIDGRIWANIYLTEDIVIINPETGIVEARVDVSGLLRPEERHPRIDVFNGIAYDKAKGRIFVTGKYWPYVFEIALVSK
jgi:glutaminyl-peptide cyclotransferase